MVFQARPPQGGHESASCPRALTREARVKEPGSMTQLQGVRVGLALCYIVVSAAASTIARE